MPRFVPDLEAQVHTPHRALAVLAVLTEDGVPVDAALAGSGLQPAALADPATRLSCRQLSTVYRQALQLAPDPATALRAGARLRLTDHSIYGYALLSSPTAAAVRDVVERYHALTTPGVALRYVGEAPHTVLRLEVALSPDPSDALARFAIELEWAAQLALAREVFGSDYRYAAVRAAYPAPAHADTYADRLGCTVTFEQSAHEIEIAPAWQDQPPGQPDASTHAQALAQCSRQLREMTQSTGSAAQVRRTLLEQMPWRYARKALMAQELQLEPRTLRRRLQDQGTTYRELLAEARCTLAIEHLRHTRMTQEEIASRLGYSDASNFRHAFVAWTGKTPQHYRKGKA